MGSFLIGCIKVRYSLLYYALLIKTIIFNLPAYYSQLLIALKSCVYSDIANYVVYSTAFPQPIIGVYTLCCCLSKEIKIEIIEIA